MGSKVRQLNTPHLPHCGQRNRICRTPLSPSDTSPSKLWEREKHEHRTQIITLPQLVEGAVRRTEGETATCD
jgi:hypothetical protein